MILESEGRIENSLKVVTSRFYVIKYGYSGGSASEGCAHFSKLNILVGIGWNK